MQDQCISPLDRLDGYSHVRIEKTLIVWQCTIYQQPSPPAIGTGDTADEAIANVVASADQRELAELSNPQAVKSSRPRRHEKHNLLDASTLAAFEEAFWERVNKDGPTVRPELGPCWLWTGGLSQGYGLLRIGGRAIRASRVSWILANRRYPNGPLIMHACDNPPCVNPSHLTPGTHHENSQDMVMKGRWVNGAQKRERTRKANRQRLVLASEMSGAV